MPDSFEIATLVDRFMRKIEAGLHGKATAMDTDRVGPFGGMVLLTLAELEPAPLHRLVSAMGRDKSQMTRAIKSLEDKGLIMRKACPEDGRVSLLSLTDKGQTFIAEVKKLLAGVIDEILRPVSREERAALLETLRKV